MEPDEKAFAEMVRRHRNLIWSICGSYRLSEAWTTEDAFHEVLCDLWRGFGSFGGRSTERTWVFRVATNTMISLTRRTSNRPSPRLSESQDRAGVPDEYDNLTELIDTLPEPDRTIIKAHAQGFSYKETAQITGLTVAAVSVRLMRALRKLRKEYDK